VEVSLHGEAIDDAQLFLVNRKLSTEKRDIIGLSRDLSVGCAF
jgi:hypothetical protein